MIDLSRYRDRVPAPRAVFDQLPALGSRPRFLIPDGGDWRAITWRGFAAQIRDVALWLAASGLAPGERCAVHATNRVEWISAALAIQAAGGVMVPIYPASTAEQAAYIARHAEARFVFVGAEVFARPLEAWGELEGVKSFVLFDDFQPAPIAEKLRARGVTVPGAAELEARTVPWSRARRVGQARHEEAPGAFAALLDALRLEQNAVMLYTSGTTGNPKGVPLTHANVAANGADWLECNAPALSEGAVDLLWLPMSHIFGFGEACLGNTLGFTTYLAEPQTVLDRLPEVRPDVFMSVPAYWEKLAQKAMEAPDRESRRLRLAEVTGGRLSFCLSGGAGLKREVKELFYECGLLVLEGYGLTECSPTLTLNRPGAFRFDSVGKPLPSVELRLAEDGEILAKGPNVFAGYHRDEEATRGCFTEDGWFKTGDVGRFTEDGFLQIVDRKKEILVTAGGKNVPPANIELRFADEPLVAHVVVYGDGKKYLVAGLWPNHEAVDARLAAEGIPAAQRAAAVRRWLGEAVERQNGHLAKYEQIKKWALLDRPLTVASGLLTSTLKVRRKKVYEAFGPELEALYEGD